MTRLLPCPFCGGPAGEVGLEFITCLNADPGERCIGKDIKVDVEHAERWNSRHGFTALLMPTDVGVADWDCSLTEYQELREEAELAGKPKMSLRAILLRGFTTTQISEGHNHVKISFDTPEDVQACRSALFAVKAGETSATPAVTITGKHGTDGAA